MELIIGIALLIMAVFLIVAVLFQSGKSHGLSGSIAGGAETFFGKEKAKTTDKILSKLTTVVAIVFVVVVLFAYIIQDDASYDKVYQDYLDKLQSSEQVKDSETEKGTEAASESDTEATSSTEAAE
ncbi:MAG: preprotein translocase subunit SecG [Ruminococcaceae bacterium]|nr:preprotein translocase subunit SecG [Oscillospiraceae bacterium]